MFYNRYIRLAKTFLELDYHILNPSFSMFWLHHQLLLGRILQCFSLQMTMPALLSTETKEGHIHCLNGTFSDNNCFFTIDETNQSNQNKCLSTLII